MNSFKGSAVEPIFLNWKAWVTGVLADLPTQKGIYLFTLSRFNNMPFYVGTATGEEGLRQRITDYTKDFGHGKKTFIKNISTFKDKDNFRHNWLTFKPNLYIPPIKDFVQSSEGANFWNYELNKYYAVLPHLVETEVSQKEYAEDVESRIQINIRSALSLSVSEIEINTRSLYLGKTSANGKTKHINIISNSDDLPTNILKLLNGENPSGNYPEGIST
jgi:hypothetical protein